MAKYSGLGMQNLVGAFLDQYQGPQPGNYAERIANLYNVTGETVGLVSAGQSRGLREWTGGRQVTAPIAYKNVITNKTYEDSLEIPVNSMRWDVTHALEQSVRDMAD